MSEQSNPYAVEDQRFPTLEAALSYAGYTEVEGGWKHVLKEEVLSKVAAAQAAGVEVRTVLSVTVNALLQVDRVRDLPIGHEPEGSELLDVLGDFGAEDIASSTYDHKNIIHTHMEVLTGGEQ